MKFNGLLLLSVLLVGSLNVVLGHVCLYIHPMENFNMEQFSGPWHAIQTTSPEIQCLVFDFHTKPPENVKNVENTQNPVNGTSSSSSPSHSQLNGIGQNLINCKEALNCGDCRDSNIIIDSYGLIGCDIAKECKNCYNSTAIRECENCIDCHECFKCTNLKGQRQLMDQHKVIPFDYNFVGILEAYPSGPSSMSVTSIPIIIQDPIPVTNDDSEEDLNQDQDPAINDYSEQDLNQDQEPSINDYSEQDINPDQTPVINLDSKEDTPKKSYFAVFATDYTTYAGVYSCRKTLDGFKHSISILSRSKDLDKHQMDNLIKITEALNIQDDLEFSIVDHENCHLPYEILKLKTIFHNGTLDEDKAYVSVYFTSEIKHDLETITMP